MKWLRWVWAKRQWLWLPFTIAAGFIAYAIGARRRDSDVVTDEFRAIEVKAKVASLVAEHDAEHARQWVEDSYADTIARLDSEATGTARRLRGDPVALAEYLDRASRG